MNRYKYFIIDTNNLFFRSFYTSAENQLNSVFEFDLNDEKEKIFTQAILRTFESVKGYLKNYGYAKDTIVYFVFDNPLSAHQIRKVLTNGQYKHGRYNKKVPKALYVSLNLFEYLVSIYSNNFRIVKNEKMEADDLTKPIIESLKINDLSKCLCISKDLDWSRNLSFNENVHWMNFDIDFDKKYIIYDRHSFKNKYKFSSTGRKVQLYKCLLGDSSDSVPVGLKAKKTEAKERNELVLYLVNAYDDLHEVFHNMWADVNVSKEWCLRIKDAENQLKQNFSVTSFMESDKSLNEMMSVCKENVKELKIWYDSFHMKLENRMIEKKDVDAFLKPYKYN